MADSVSTKCVVCREQDATTDLRIPHPSRDGTFLEWSCCARCAAPYIEWWVIPDPDWAAHVSKAAAFYKALVDGGVSEITASNMTQEFNHQFLRAHFQH